MAKKLILLIVVSFWFLCYCFSSDAQVLKGCEFNKIYQLGDSFSDTGNLIREVPTGAASLCGRLPYGRKYFQNSTGRCSDGRLLFDFIAEELGFPSPPPYKNSSADVTYGVNFAVAGSTALPSDVLAADHILSPVTNSSLSVQLDWMSTYFNSTCYKDRDCGEKLKDALFIIGDFGRSDYNYAIFQGKTMEELRCMVPKVVDAIIFGVRKAISFGASHLVVPGIFPIGCLPIYQTAFQTNISAAYDESHCLKELNDIAKYHNEQLQQAIDKLKQESPNAIIVYGDYYAAYEHLIEYAKDFEIDWETACCGIGGKYNFNLTRMCGEPDVPVCAEFQDNISWDGVHLTDVGNSIMIAWWVFNIANQFQCHF